MSFIEYGVLPTNIFIDTLEEVDVGGIFRSAEKGAGGHLSRCASAARLKQWPLVARKSVFFDEWAQGVRRDDRSTSRRR